MAKLLLYLLHHPQIQPCPYDSASNWWGASDASEHPDGPNILKVGWQTRRLGGSTTTRFPQRPPLGTQRWGSHSSNFCFGDVWHSDPHSFPLGQRRQGTPSRLSFISDNQGNIFALLNQKTKQMPTSAFLTAGSFTHEESYNQWAGELTHPCFAEFRPERQLHVSEAFSQFNILWSLLEETNLQDRFPKDVRPTQRPPKVPWSLVVAAVCVLTWWCKSFWCSFAPGAKAPGFEGWVGRLCDTTTVLDVASWREPADDACGITNRLP